MNAQKSLAFLYTNDEKSQREIKETQLLLIYLCLKSPAYLLKSRNQIRHHQPP